MDQHGEGGGDLCLRIAPRDHTSRHVLKPDTATQHQRSGLIRAAFGGDEEVVAQAVDVLLSGLLIARHEAEEGGRDIGGSAHGDDRRKGCPGRVADVG